MANTPKERQAARRRELKAQGAHRTSVTLSSKAISALRQITAEHGVTQSEAIELGILAAAKWLAEEERDA
ncbi:MULTISPECIES: hypothetical protein [Aeromonas]|uniref:hypothetical protein n=1 Tax=Aeromonas TaxID=642 RepID=UPI000375E2CE|nr:hypothetical protein [Aeromonas dhakensis]TNI44076.1 hypothetical protein CF130_11735 [Aeromonas dhakensis]